MYISFFLISTPELIIHIDGVSFIFPWPEENTMWIQFFRQTWRSLYWKIQTRLGLNGSQIEVVHRCISWRMVEMCVQQKQPVSACENICSSVSAMPASASSAPQMWPGFYRSELDFILSVFTRFWFSFFYFTFHYLPRYFSSVLYIWSVSWLSQSFAISEHIWRLLYQASVHLKGNSNLLHSTLHSLADV